jgi:hypothetical protein
VYADTCCAHRPLETQSRREDLTDLTLPIHGPSLDSFPTTTNFELELKLTATQTHIDGVEVADGRKIDVRTFPIRVVPNP